MSFLNNHFAPNSLMNIFCAQVSALRERRRINDLSYPFRIYSTMLGMEVIYSPGLRRLPSFVFLWKRM